MPSVLSEIRDLKTQAKNRRDLRRYERAAALLEKAIDIGRKNLDVVELRSQIASELADCYGLLGGVQRRWALASSVGEEHNEHMRESIRAYDEGWRLESGDYGVVNSYGMVNRLISRLLLNPAALSGGAFEFASDIESVNVREELECASRRILHQLANPRRDDYWAMADLALVHGLLGKDDAISLYSSFIAKSPPDYAYSSVLDVLRPLSRKDFAVAPTLQRAVSMLEERFTSSHSI